MLNGNILKKEDVIKKLLYAIGAFLISVFLATRSITFLDSWKNISLPQRWIWSIACVFCAICLLCGKWIKDYLRESIQLSLISVGIVFLISIWMSYIMYTYYREFPVALTMPSLYGIGRKLTFAGSCLILWLFLLLLVSALKKIFTSDRMKSFVRSITVKDILVLVAVAVLFHIGISIYYYYVKTIYYWDNANYWLMARNMAYALKNKDLHTFFWEMWNSVLYWDYNEVPVFFCAVAASVGNLSRKAFVLVNFYTYVFPVYCLLYFKFGKKTKYPFLTLILCILTTPWLIHLLVHGYVDVGAALLILLIYMLLDSKEGSTQRFFLAGCLMAECILFRRWLSFFVISLFIVQIVYLLYKKRISQMISMGIPLVFVIMYFFQSLVTEKLLQNYAEQYAAYNYGFAKTVKTTLLFVGCAILILLLVFVVISIVKKWNREKILLIALQSILCFLLFARVQTPSQHHVLLYIPAVMMLSGELFLYLSMHKGKIMKIATAVVLLGNISSMLVEPIDLLNLHNIEESEKMYLDPKFTITDLNPIVDEDADEMVAMMKYLDETIGEAGQTIGVLASSYTLNTDRMQHTEVSLNIERESECDRSYIVHLPEIDTRDGYDDTIYNCDYLLVTDPIQASGAQTTQGVVLYPSESILAGTDIGQAYEQLPQSFTLAGDVKVYIYEKTREVTEEEKQVILQRLWELHEGYEYLFQ